MISALPSVTSVTMVCVPLSHLLLSMCLFLFYHTVEYHIHLLVMNPITMFNVNGVSRIDKPEIEPN